MSGPALAVRDARPDEIADWDTRTVDPPGGHVYQSRAWAEHRSASGWRPRYVVLGDHARVLALERPWPLLPGPLAGASAYVPRGPIPDASPETTASRLIAVAAHLAEQSTDVIAADPEVGVDTSFGSTIGAAGFHQIEELQPSRHKVALPIGDADEAAVFDGIAKSTRQRIRKAEAADTVAARHDAGWANDDSQAFFARPTDTPAVALDRFYDLLLATGERLHFSFGPRTSFVSWWTSALAAGHLVLLEARDGSTEGELLGGLVLYRHGDRLSTVHSGDVVASRKSHPGTMHLLRWRAIQLAIREGRREVDLGGVDVAGSRHEPREGDPMWGLYQHKLSFGARWVELAGAHERIVRPWRYGLGRLVSRVARARG